MTDWFFKPEDFIHCCPSPTIAGNVDYPQMMAVADAANARLKAEREKMPVVMGRMILGPESTWWSTFTGEGEEPGTHRARLEGIEEIK
jgi:hypothetical protein